MYRVLASKPIIHWSTLYSSSMLFFLSFVEFGVFGLFLYIVFCKFRLVTGEIVCVNNSSDNGQYNNSVITQRCKHIHRKKMFPFLSWRHKMHISMVIFLCFDCNIKSEFANALPIDLLALLVWPQKKLYFFLRYNYLFI